MNNAERQRPGRRQRHGPVKNSVDFTVIKAAMADLQRVYVEKAVEVPLYYRKQVDLHAPRLGNFFAQPDPGRTRPGTSWTGSSPTDRTRAGRSAGAPQDH